MGKHERNAVEEAEKIIVKILKNINTTLKDQRNIWYDHAVGIAKQIKIDYPNLVSAKHLGNRYNNTGDILLKLPSKNLYIETKMSDTKAGRGTKANISQNALTENGLFLGNVKSWSDFRTEARHNQWVEELLNGFKKYPKSILDILNTNNSIESKARYLRDKGHKKILEEIREHDRKEKLEYLSYLSQQKQDYKKIKRFYILLMLGIHKKEYLADLINDNHFFEEVENLLIYYSNKHKDEILVSKEDIHERLSNALKDSDIFKITFSKDLTYCKIIKQNKNKEKQLLSIVFHWKNIAQGIKTPCLNIFD